MRISYATLILYDKIIPFSKRSVNAETAVYGSISKNGYPIAVDNLNTLKP